ncbi:hypothetical protein AB9F38_36420, partial [Rhizobium leguminosarum]
RAGNIADLSGFVTDQKIDSAPFCGLIEELTIDGNIYSLPFRSDFWVFYYNKDIFDVEGVAGGIDEFRIFLVCAEHLV